MRILRMIVSLSREKLEGDDKDLLFDYTKNI